MMHKPGVLKLLSGLICMPPVGQPVAGPRRAIPENGIGNVGNGLDRSA